MTAAALVSALVALLWTAGLTVWVAALAREVRSARPTRVRVRLHDDQRRPGRRGDR